jgi:hypothetical protein
MRKAAQAVFFLPEPEKKHGSFTPWAAFAHLICVIEINEINPETYRCQKNQPQRPSHHIQQGCDDESEQFEYHPDSRQYACSLFRLCSRHGLFLFCLCRV